MRMLNSDKIALSAFIAPFPAEVLGMPNIYQGLLILGLGSLALIWRFYLPACME